MKNWYIEAKKSDDSQVKELLTQFDSLDATDPKREELKTEIKSLLPLEVEVVTEKKTEKPSYCNIDFSFKYTEQDVKDCFDIALLDSIYRESLKRVEEVKKQRKRPEYEGYQERIEFDSKLWAIERIGLQAKNKSKALTFEIRKQEKMASPLSKMAYKRNIFITEYNRGISISNIVRNHTADFSKEDLPMIINEDVIEKIQRDSDRYFSEKWARWKEKFLNKNIDNS